MKNLKTHEKETKIRRKFPRNGTEDEWELLLYGLLNLSDEQNGKPFGSAFMPFDFSIWLFVAFFTSFCSCFSLAE